MSGPLLDRLDLQIEVPALTSEELLVAAAGESSAAVRERVLAARKRQQARGCLNATLSNAALSEHCALDAAGRRLIAGAVDRGGMSARAVHRAMRVARTIADLACEGRVGAARCYATSSDAGPKRDLEDGIGLLLNNEGIGSHDPGK